MALYRDGPFVARLDGLWRQTLLAFEDDGADKLRRGMDPLLVERQELIRDCGLDVVPASWHDVHSATKQWAERVRARMAAREGVRLAPGVELVSTTVRVTPLPIEDTYRWLARP